MAVGKVQIEQYQRGRLRLQTREGVGEPGDSQACERKSWRLARNRALRAGVEHEVLNTTTGIVCRVLSALASASTARPSFLGRFKSRIAKTGRTASACRPMRCRKASASSPSSTLLMRL